MKELFQRSPGVPALNLDVFGLVCAFLTEYPDFLSLSLTCSVLHPLAIRNMLRSRPVFLQDVNAIIKFHDFIFADAAARLPHLVALKVDASTSKPDQADPECGDRAIEALFVILRHASSLVSLDLLSSANGRPLGHLDDPRVAAAVGELTALRELTIGGQAEVADFIGAVRAPLTKLTLRFTRLLGGVEEWSLTSLGAALSNVTHSLESLTITQTRVRLDGGSPGSVPTALTGVQFHALQSLTLDHLVFLPHLPLLLDLFPNLDGTLHLTPYLYDVPDAVDYDTLLETTRERNSKAQEQRCWKRLARLVCDVETLFVLNLKCPVGLTVVLDLAYKPDADPGRHESLVSSLRDHPPTRLNLQLVLSGQPSLSGMIPPEAGATLTHLTLCVEYSKYTVDPPSLPSAVRWDDIWVSPDPTELLLFLSAPAMTPT